MDKIIMLGTGHATTSKCFNTCFIYENEKGKMLVDTGGGQQLVTQLCKANIPPNEIKYVFLSHRHTDHILGLPWLLRMRARNLDSNPLTIIAHSELCKIVQEFIPIILPETAEHIGKSLNLISVEHEHKMPIMGRDFLFFNTFSDNVTQFGFVMSLSDGGKFVFNGDVPYNEANFKIISGAKWLMHEAFCPENECEHPLHGHSSVSHAAQNAKTLFSESLIIVHSSDNALHSRKKRYTLEAARCYDGNILIPDDLETIEL